ncbi:hypothetical protein NL676_012109 [Syzygium grande]|nr:hypothetical protein NL676_012109 [Syzygium grande]
MVTGGGWPSRWVRPGDRATTAEGSPARAARRWVDVAFRGRGDLAVPSLGGPWTPSWGRPSTDALSSPKDEAMATLEYDTDKKTMRPWPSGDGDGGMTAAADMAARRSWWHRRCRLGSSCCGGG